MLFSERAPISRVGSLLFCIVPPLISFAAHSCTDEGLVPETRLQHGCFVLHVHTFILMEVACHLQFLLSILITPLFFHAVTLKLLFV
jgi:hypothetical protein